MQKVDNFNDWNQRYEKKVLNTVVDPKFYESDSFSQSTQTSLISFHKNISSCKKLKNPDGRANEKDGLACDEKGWHACCKYSTHLWREQIVTDWLFQLNILTPVVLRFEESLCTSIIYLPIRHYRINCLEFEWATMDFNGIKAINNVFLGQTPWQVSQSFNYTTRLEKFNCWNKLSKIYFLL